MKLHKTERSREGLAGAAAIFMILLAGAFTFAGLGAAVPPKPEPAASARTAPAPGDGCDLAFEGSDRKAVKLRPAGLDYTFLNGGRPLSLPDFFAAVCPLDERVPTRRSEVPADEPLPEERIKIKVRGFVMALKLEDDNDLHVQIADRAAPFDQEQIVVEIPPGADYCDARTAMMALFRADGGTSVRRHVFNSPPQVDVTGYLFLDAAHMRARRTDYCTDNGGRGVRAGRGASPVRGIWELHPVVKLEPVGVVPARPNTDRTPAASATTRPRPEVSAGGEGDPDARVWVNTNSGVYHCPGTRWYGRTKEGAFMTQREARQKGNRPAYGSVCK
jgi:hypothetical protein